jgi:tetratricopeptide (TPR) repeat protein
MKKMVNKGIVVLVVLASFTLSSMAQAYLQNPKYGPDEESRKHCAMNLSLYRESYNQKNYNDARKPWQAVLKNCPAASQNAYIHGARMLKEWIEIEKNPKRKTELLDSLMMLYDMRIENFPEGKGSLLGQKGMDLYTIDPLRFEEAYTFMNESIEIEKETTGSSSIYTFMVITKDMYDNKKINADKVIETYSMLADYLDIQIAAKPDDERTVQVKETVDAIFSSAGVANCENLVAIFGPRIDANPKDVGLVKKTFNLLNANKCNTIPLYRITGELVFGNEPTPSLAYELSRIYNGLGEFRKSERFYQEAIKLESDSVKKSVYLVEYAGIVAREFNNPQLSRTLALQAVSANPGIGHAYIQIGLLYASEKACGDDFARQTVYWAAVDKFVKAKQVDPNLAGECDRLIDFYTQYFPAGNEIFFQDLKPGDSFTVGCWINERTTVRAKP